MAHQSDSSMFPDNSKQDLQKMFNDQDRDLEMTVENLATSSSTPLMIAERRMVFAIPNPTALSPYGQVTTAPRRPMSESPGKLRLRNEVQIRLWELVLK